MHRYKYKAISATGQRIQGIWTGPDESAFFTMIQEQRVHLIFHKRITPLTFRFFKSPTPSPLLIAAIHQLAQLTKAGVLLIDGLKLLNETLDDKKIRGVFLNILDTVQRGIPFADALEAHALFDRVVISLVKQADKNGNYAKALTESHEHLTWMLEIRTSLREALRYPMLLLVLLSLLVVVLFHMVIPEARLLFETLGVEKDDQPFVFFLADHGAEFFGILVLFSSVLGLGLWILRRTGLFSTYSPPHRLFRHYFIDSRDLGLFLKNLAILSRHGMPFLYSLRESTHILSPSPLKNKLETLPTLIQQGALFSSALSALQTIDPMTCFMIKTGEKSGHLNDSMLCVAHLLQEKHEQRIKRALTWIEPFGLFVVATLILSIFWTIFLPLYDQAFHLES
ncbi:MAG: type II secretion system F family protein [Alphaproteobacteria bacterium]|nr:type II secretion system F family protein [Alphaproteobacteria bacterium]